MDGPTTYRFADAEWHVPISPGTDPDQAAEAGQRGVRRRLLAQGDSGFYTQVVEVPPGFEAPEHSHDHAEVFMVLAGGCTVNGRPMGPYDTTVIPAGAPYGFTSGPDGLTFLVVRTGAAGYTAT